MAESEEEPKSLWMKVKESEKDYLNTKVRKLWSWHLVPSLHGKQWQTLFSWAPKSLQIVTATMKLKDTCFLKKSYDQPWQLLKSNITNKGSSSESYGFSSSHIWMWELEYKEGWAPKNWCFWSVVLGKTCKFLGLQEDSVCQY